MAKAQGKAAVEALANAVAVELGEPGPATPQAGKRVIWAHAADDAHVPTNGYSAKVAWGVFRSWGGSIATHAPNIISVQGYANGPDVESTLELLERMYNALLWPDDDPESPGTPRREWTAGGFVLAILSLTPPALIGTDEERRIDGAFNFEMGYRPV